MTPQIVFENHFSARVVEIFFPEGFSIASEQDLVYLKEQWTKNLKSWHSPYTCLFDLRNFSIVPEMQGSFDKTVQFFSNFFMRKIIGFCDENSCPPKVNFEVIVGYDKAVLQTGLAKGAGLKRDLESLRSRIQIDNDFNAHVMEVQLLAETEFVTKEDILVLKDKMKNILRQWHTPYSVLFNCVNCSFAKEAYEEFLKFEKFLKAFFCKQILGYAPKMPKESYPFKMYRSRHLAAAELENSGIQSGAVANCSTKKVNS
ncbi:MAG: hypothetical protein V4591_02195 [Bdellovibrionota bacterium]